MSKCKHNRLIDKLKNGDLPSDFDNYYCNQCQSHVAKTILMPEVDRRRASEVNRRQTRT